MKAFYTRTLLWLMLQKYQQQQQRKLLKKNVMLIQPKRIGWLLEYSKYNG